MNRHSYLSNDELDVALGREIEAARLAGLDTTDELDALFSERSHRIRAAQVVRVRLTSSQVDHVYLASFLGDEYIADRVTWGKTFIEGLPADLEDLAFFVSSDGYLSDIVGNGDDLGESMNLGLQEHVAQKMIACAERAAWTIYAALP